MTKKFNVHVFTSVRVKVSGVTAASPQEAYEKAQEVVDLGSLLEGGRSVQLNGGMKAENAGWDEGQALGGIVDPILPNGEVDDEASQFIKPAPHEASVFMDELLASVETLTGVAEQHGPSVLANLFYLHAAILKGSFIDLTDDATSGATSEIVSNLPTAARWMTFVKIT